MSDEAKKPHWKVVSAEGAAEAPETVAFVERLVNSPEFEKRSEASLQEEWTRQVIFGLPPSEGIPDIRCVFSAYGGQSEETEGA